MIEDIHDVRVRRTPVGLVVNYHCYVEDALDVADVHKNVDLLERRFRKRHPGVVRGVGHAEPRRGSAFVKGILSSNLKEYSESRLKTAIDSAVYPEGRDIRRAKTKVRTVTHRSVGRIIS